MVIEVNEEYFEEYMKGLGYVKVTKCKDCKYFELNHWDNVDSVPIITAHEICKKWGDGCKTSLEGFCFMGEKNEERTNG